MRVKSFRAAALALVVISCFAAKTRADIIFDNQNGLGVFEQPSGPPVPTTFTLTADTYITLIDIYHFNDTGTSATIGITDSFNTIIGTWVATVSNPYPYTHFEVSPDILLGAGTYTITDLDYALWSYNEASGNEGFATVQSGVAPAPEPDSLALLGVGLAGLGFWRRHRRA
jgi:hypothetical protein